MRKFFVLALLLPVIMGCASSDNIIVGSEIVIVNSSLQRRFNVEVNEQLVGTLRSGANRAVQVPNGRNSIWVGYRIARSSGGLSSRRDAQDWFLVTDFNNERVVVEAFDNSWGDVRLRVVSRTALHQPPPGDPLQAAAIASAFNTLDQLIPNGSRIAIVDIAHGNESSVFAQDHLTLLLVNSQRYAVVDRQSLDVVRAEQGFQLTGEVSDATAVSIGHFLGADVVIVGNIAGNGPERRLQLRAISVRTAQILAMALEAI